MIKDIKDNVVRVVILDISGKERASMTVNGLLDRFKDISKKELDNDRMMLD